MDCLLSCIVSFDLILEESMNVSFTLTLIFEVCELTASDNKINGVHV